VKPTPKRIFLGWDQPLLPRAVKYLGERYVSGSDWDLSSVRLVVPTGRAKRRLAELLRGEARRQGLELKQPRILTVGELPEQLYTPDREIALELEQTLAWVRVLTSASPKQLQPLMPTLPPPEPISPWMEFAAAVRRLHETLAADGLTFADVVPFVETAAEQKRWKLLDKLLQAYHQQMAAADRCDSYTARVEAIRNGRCRADFEIVIIGASDLNRSLCQMLDAVAEQVTVLIAAPQANQILFDSYGSVQPQEWTMWDLPLRDEHLIGAGDATEQAEAMAGQLADLGCEFSADAITVGVTDESLVTFVETELQQCGVSAHRELGWPLSQTAPGRLLSLIVLVRTRMNWNALASLVRHADVYDWIDRQLPQPARGQRTSPWLTQLDSFLGDHFPTQLDVPLPAAAIEAYPQIAALSQLVMQWLAPLNVPPQSLAQWCHTMAQVVATIYPLPDEEDLPDDARQGPDMVTESESGASLADNQRTQLAVERVHFILQRFASLSDQLDVDVPASAAIEMLLGRLTDAPIVLPARSEMVEVVGWLDLALDDAPAMVVVGLNHPYVPESITADPFLPGSLRSRLNISDNERRFARDAYSLQLILSTRAAVSFIVGRRGPDGSPTPPSRLLSAASGTDVARRVMKLLDQPPAVAPVSHLWSGKNPHTELPIPIAGTADIDVMSVTAFSDFLRCPYRFYLRHHLKIRPLDDQARELQANQFGDLVHAALEDFGAHEDHRQATAEEEIRSRLLEHLHAYAAKRFGAEPAAAVTLQIHQAERRLSLVAEKQAIRRAEGWEIRRTEASVDPQQGAGIDVDGRRMGLRGRFDRIDFHPASGRWAILDYKTHSHEPLKKHIDSTTGAWTDLQLPLYRLMAPFLDIDGPIEEIQLGYFNVAEQAEKTGVHLAEFSDEQFQQANQVIEDCIRRIWANDFAIMGEDVPFDDYGMICQTGLAQSMFAELLEAGTEEFTG